MKVSALMKISNNNSQGGMSKLCNITNSSAEGEGLVIILENFVLWSLTRGEVVIISK